MPCIALLASILSIKNIVCNIYFAILSPSVGSIISSRQSPLSSDRRSEPCTSHVSIVVRENTRSRDVDPSFFFFSFFSFFFLFSFFFFLFSFFFFLFSSSSSSSFSFFLFPLPLPFLSIPKTSSLNFFFDYHITGIASINSKDNDDNADDDDD